MSHDAIAGQDTELATELASESLKRMIYFTRREAEKDGRTFCAYLLSLAMKALDEETDEINAAVKSKFAPVDRTQDLASN
ncbi:hypothetical protein GWI72_07405 [Microvirga tunisiensis]|uniref:Uncharacterized protein n=2 Tax=Pannonibacter tanglangensis TaxID=2750084 RepID=A0ABW9ZC92_9HYPH|nr:hypothetical protein [Pannonibacter sp. XCT-34]NBN78091.1 hypothetical protein [Pannonibacter sp. XCT-53]